ncbi:PIN domain-containing protein [Verrucomicrobia bacterium]|nr:PIN domain-containing protein [Verrucomicrobiota bacterium]
MKVIVDTDVWSEAFRKKKGGDSVQVKELRLLLEEGRVEMLGFIRMEILCGIRDEASFKKIESRLALFPDRPLTSEAFVMAAQFFNLCRGKGIQGSNNDFLICAASVTWDLPILTKDKDFARYRKLLPISLQKLR